MELSIQPGCVVSAGCRPPSFNGGKQIHKICKKQVWTLVRSTVTLYLICLKLPKSQKQKTTTATAAAYDTSFPEGAHPEAFLLQVYLSVGWELKIPVLMYGLA